jgi:hypothetical protein
LYVESDVSEKHTASVFTIGFQESFYIARFKMKLSVTLIQRFEAQSFLMRTTGSRKLFQRHTVVIVRGRAVGLCGTLLRNVGVYLQEDVTVEQLNGPEVITYRHFIALVPSAVNLGD